MKDNEFATELTKLLNRHCVDARANTPDYILANFLLGVIDSVVEMRSAQIERNASA